MWITLLTPPTMKATPCDVCLMVLAGVGVDTQPSCHLYLRTHDTMDSAGLAFNASMDMCPGKWARARALAFSFSLSLYILGMLSYLSSLDIFSRRAFLLVPAQALPAIHKRRQISHDDI